MVVGSLVIIIKQGNIITFSILCMLCWWSNFDLAKYEGNECQTKEHSASILDAYAHMYIQAYVCMYVYTFRFIYETYKKIQTSTKKLHTYVYMYVHSYVHICSSTLTEQNMLLMLMRVCMYIHMYTSEQSLQGWSIMEAINPTR